MAALTRQFLAPVRQLVRDQDGAQLAAWLQVEPSAPNAYHEMAAELRRAWANDDALDSLIDECLPLDGDDAPDGRAGVWPSFQAFAKDYLLLWRDADYDDYLECYELLLSLVNSCGTAFAHPQHGAMLMPLCMSLCESLARFTMLLHHRPDVTYNMRRRLDEDGNPQTVAEVSAETIQKIFKTCLMDRSAGRTPEGKKAGIYMFANLVLKMLFACKKLTLATMIFLNMSTTSPPLRLYPASQRVTYLFHVGRYNWGMSHYLRAALALEQAYLQTPPGFLSHRIKLLTYLIPTNMLLGRFPSARLMARPEAETLRPVFQPLCEAVRQGNFITFQAQIEKHGDWLWDKGLYLQMCYRMRSQLWRTLARKTFILTYIPQIDGESRRAAATLDLEDLLTVATYIQRRLEGWIPAKQLMRAWPPAHVNSFFVQAVTKNVQVSEETTLIPPPTCIKLLRPSEGLVTGNMPITMDYLEMVIASLITSEMMHGFIAHSRLRFAIIGAKAKGPVLAGWPTVWQAIQERKYDEPYDPNEVPGWVRD